MIEGVSNWICWGVGCEGSVERCIKERVSIIGRMIQHISGNGETSEMNVANQRRSFSLLRFVGLAGLLLGVRGQKTDPFPAVIDLANLDPSDGFAIDGTVPMGHAGRTSVTYAGDLNADGIDDFAFPSSGRKLVHIFFGRKNLGMNGTIDESMSDVVITLSEGEAYSIFGGSDLNNDEYDDLIIGGSGRVHVVFGGPILDKEKSLLTSNFTESNGFSFLHHSAFGFSLSSGGDINGDNIHDLLIGNFVDSRGAGAAFVIFGGPHLGKTGPINVSDIPVTEGFKIVGENATEQFGANVSIVGDINNDGFDDMIVGAGFGSNKTRGAAYIFFGSNQIGNKGNIDLSVNQNYRINIFGDTISSPFLRPGSKVGNINHDNIDDFVLLRSNVDYSIHVFYGKSEFDILKASDTWSFENSDGFDIISDGNFRHKQVEGGGDVNGDGFLDLLIGARYVNPMNRIKAGKCYVIFGGMGAGMSGKFDLENINGSNGFTIIGENAGDESGNALSIAGDMNDDGVDDILIGAPYASPNNITEAGKMYVIFGRKLGHPLKDTKITMGTTEVIPTSEELTSQKTTGTSKESTITINTRMLPSTDAPSSTGLAIGVGLGLTAFVCSLVGGGLFYRKRKGDSNSFSGAPDQEDPLAGYVSIDLIKRNMHSARAENAPNSNYDIIPSKKLNGDYNNWPSKPPEHKVEDYDKVGLNTLNRKMDEHQATKFKDAHEEYDDISPVIV